MASSNVVFIVVDTNYSSSLVELLNVGPVRVIDTPENQKAVQTCRSEMHNTFQPDTLTTFRSTAISPEDCVIGILDTVDLHHGMYSADTAYASLAIIGARPSTSVKEVLALYKLTKIAFTSTGFVASM